MVGQVYFEANLVGPQGPLNLHSTFRGRVSVGELPIYRIKGLKAASQPVQAGRAGGFAITVPPISSILHSLRPSVFHIPELVQACRNVQRVKEADMFNGFQSEQAILLVVFADAVD
jgi:hypothetical protein